ncbi:MAG: TetR/AcrR family transcriptional regulator [Aeromicrobium sp.]|nr:TetR/AcrR family transcriptional regulator [Aeromicrobium sp.]
MSRRDELAEGATDYALEHGLIGLSLRPLAAALDTSDRMLNYHFGSKDALIAAVLAVSNERSLVTIRALPVSASIRQGVLDLWDAFTEPQVARCQRMYVEAASLGLFGREPYAASVRQSNESWLAALATHLERSGASKARAPRLATLVDATFNGLMLDRPLDGDTAGRRVVVDLADALS